MPYFVMGPDGRLRRDAYTEYAAQALIENHPSELGKKRKGFLKKLAPFRHIRMLKKLIGKKKRKGVPEEEAVEEAPAEAPSFGIPLYPAPYRSYPPIEERVSEPARDVESPPQYPPQPSVEERETVEPPPVEERETAEALPPSRGIPEATEEYLTATAQVPEQSVDEGFSGAGGYIVEQIAPTPVGRDRVEPRTWVSTLRRREKIFGPSGEVFHVPGRPGRRMRGPRPF